MDPPIPVDPADARRGGAPARASADELAALFAATRGDAGHLPSDLGVRLVDLCRKPRTERVDDRELVSALAVRAPLALAELDGYLAHCRPGDLALALAAGRGIASAITDLERAHRITLDSTCRRFASAAYTVDDLRRSLRTRLFVAEPGKPPKVLDYAGQGLLDSWLRVTAVRMFLDLAQRDVRAVDEAVPEGAVEAEHRAVVAAAVCDATKLMRPGDRHLLRQHFVANLSIDQLGAVLGIHRATAARRLARARECLVATTRAELVRRLGLAPDEVDEIIGLVTSRLSIVRLLASGA